MIARGWKRKAWKFQVQNEAMRENFKHSLLGNLGNLVDDITDDIQIPDFYLDMDVLDCLCHYLTRLGIKQHELHDLNDIIEIEDNVTSLEDETINLEVEDDVAHLELDDEELEEREQAAERSFEVHWP
jgi:hypothetical protein